MRSVRFAAALLLGLTAYSPSLSDIVESVEVNRPSIEASLSPYRPDGTSIQPAAMTPINPVSYFSESNDSPAEFIEKATLHVAGNGPSLQFTGKDIGDYFSENDDPFYTTLANSLKEANFSTVVREPISVRFNCPGLKFELRKEIPVMPDVKFDVLPSQNLYGIQLVKNPRFNENSQDGEVRYCSIKTLEGTISLAATSFTARLLSFFAGGKIPPLQDAKYLIIVDRYLIYLDGQGKELCVPSTVQLESLEWFDFERRFGEEYQICHDAVLADIRTAGGYHVESPSLLSNGSK